MNSPLHKLISVFFFSIQWTHVVPLFNRYSTQKYSHSSHVSKSHSHLEPSPTMRLVNYYSNVHIKSFEIAGKHRHSLQGSWKREQELQAQQDALLLVEALELIRLFLEVLVMVVISR